MMFEQPYAIQWTFKCPTENGVWTMSHELLFRDFHGRSRSLSIGRTPGELVRTVLKVVSQSSSLGRRSVSFLIESA